MDLVKLANCTITTEEMREFKMHNLWKEQTAIIVFMRHFACIACRAHAKEIWQRRSQCESKGAKIHFVGNGGVNFIEGFKEDLGIEDAPVYTDPSLESFQAAGFRRGFLASLGPTAIKNALKLKKANPDLPAKYEKGMGDLWQLGGIISVSKDGRLIYHHINEALGDYPPEKDPLGIH